MPFAQAELMKKVFEIGREPIRNRRKPRMSKWGRGSVRRYKLQQDRPSKLNQRSAPCLLALT